MGVFLGVHEPGFPPIIGLYFTDGEIGREIFARLLDRFGHRDTHGELHLAILRDIPGHPDSHYGALITAGMNLVDDGCFMTVPSRLKILEPDTDVNLRRFLDRKSTRLNSSH